MCIASLVSLDSPAARQMKEACNPTTSDGGLSFPVYPRPTYQMNLIYFSCTAIMKDMNDVYALGV